VDGNSVHSLGSVSDGRGVPADPSRAADSFLRACDAGEPRGCVNLGVLTANGTGVLKDDVRARELYQRACDGGDEESCKRVE